MSEFDLKIGEYDKWLRAQKPVVTVTVEVLYNKKEGGRNE